MVGRLSTLKGGLCELSDWLSFVDYCTRFQESKGVSCADYEFITQLIYEYTEGCVLINERHPSL
jgi:hypothetical protein